MINLIIDREDTFNSCATCYKVVLDNKKIGEISNGQVKEYSIEKGKHSLFLKAALEKSNTISFIIDDYNKVIINCKMGLLEPKLSIKSNITYKSPNLKY